jgi:hypothetical protein
MYVCMYVHDALVFHVQHFLTHSTACSLPGNGIFSHSLSTDKRRTFVGTQLDRTRFPSNEPSVDMSHILIFR